MEPKTLNHHTMFYEDQHKLAAYLERHPDAEWQWGEIAIWHQGGTPDTFLTPSEAVAAGHPIRPVLRYGLPSHLQSEIHNPDNLTEEQICEGGKYRAVTKSESANQPHEYYHRLDESWEAAIPGSKSFSSYGRITYRLPAAVPWPDWEAGPEVCADKPQPVGNQEQAAGPVSPWRPMSEVPTEEDCDKLGYVLGLHEEVGIMLLRVKDHSWPKGYARLLAWMPVPKFHGWPDPLTDLLKSHGVEVTPEILAALNAWKGVQP